MADKHEPLAAQGAFSSADRPPLVDQMGDDQGSVVYLVLICFVATLGGLLFGYDTAVISGAISFLQGHFDLNATMTGWAAACVLLGCAAGSVGAGPLNDVYGRKKALVFAVLVFLGSSVGTALAPTLNQFVIFRVAAGIAVGLAAVTSPMYIAEISPAHIRGRMVSLNQFAIIFGMLVVYFVNYFIASLGDQTWNENVGWRWMFASGAFPSLALLLFLLWVPESPRWLVKQARADEAQHVLSRISGSRAASHEIAAIKEALRHEGESVWQLLAPGMRVALGDRCGAGGAAAGHGDQCDSVLCARDLPARGR